ncbi:MAG TPA: hypothetical protein VFD59_17830 [Nocardioidaceae bacterium]|nr:hypothetical protein [Nocardioidaceae bacterium]
MSGRRGRPVRFPDPGDLPEPPADVRVIGPVVFSLVFDGRARTIDLSDLPCPRLVRALAQALAGIGGQDGTVREWSGFAGMVKHLRAFVAFAAAAVPGGDLGLGDVEPELLEAFETQVGAGYGSGSSQPHEWMRTVVRLLRLAGQDAPGVLSVHMQARVGYATTTAFPSRPRPLDACPLGVFEAIGAAALADVRRIRDRIAAGERLAATGTDPRVAGWSRLENVLWHVARHGPLTTGEHSGIWAVDNTHGGVRAVNQHLFLTSADLVPLVVALIVATGLEPECVKGLRADCLVNPVSGFVSIAYVKKRARNNSHKTIRVRDGGALHFPGGLIALVRRLTQRGRQLSGSDLLWIDVRYDGVHPSFGTSGSFNRNIGRWAHRHGLGALSDRGGGAVRLDLRRLRKTYKSRHYQRSAGMLDDFAQGHSKQVAARHYADIDAHNQVHEDAIEAGLRQALAVGLALPVVADEHGRPLGQGDADLTPAQVHAATSQDTDVFLASCTGFHASPFARTPGEGCPVAVWGCLECPNAVYTTRHLPSLLSFTGFLHAQRDELPAPEWQARYGLAFERLTTGITPRFTPEQITTARLIVEAGDPILSLPAHLLEHST